MTPLLKGAGAGFVASVLGFFAIYLYLCVRTGVTLEGDPGALVLASVTYIPLMMLFVVLLPNALLGVLLGLALGAIGRVRGALPGLPVGVLLGVAGGHLIFRIFLPWFVSHRPGDNDVTVLLTPLPFVAVYGALLGGLVWRLCRKI